MAYNLVTGSSVVPTETSYQLITLTGNIVLSWPSSFSSGPIAYGFNNVTTAQNGYTIALPDATLAALGIDIVFNNISAHTFSILDNGNNVLIVMDPGDIIDFKLTDNSSANGSWLQIPYGGGVAGIVSVIASSSDSSITITNGTLTPPGGKINFQLPTSISNLNDVDTTGIPIITNIDPLTWDTVTLVAGTNITITNPDGTTGNPTITLSSTLIALTSLAVGNFSMTASTLTTSVTNGSLIFTSNGTGTLSYNGVITDTSSNVSAINNLTVNGNLTVSGTVSNPRIPKAWAYFTDSGSTIVIKDNSTISSITGAGTGHYICTFTSTRSNANYGVIVNVATDGATLPSVAFGFPIASTQSTTSFTIAVVDASGQYVSSAPNGITVIVMSSS